MRHFGWTDAFHKQHNSRVIWSTLCYWIRKQINIWREKGGSRGHHKSIHQSNHTVNNACRKLKGSLLMIKQEKQSYCWIILFFPVCFCFMKLNGICSTWLIEWQSIFFLSREGRANADGKIPLPNSLDPSLSVFTGHFWQNNKKHSQNSEGYSSWIKNIDSTIHSFWCTVKEKYSKNLEQIHWPDRQPFPRNNL